jgi:hypothetical protein
VFLLISLIIIEGLSSQSENRKHEMIDHFTTIYSYNYAIPIYVMTATQYSTSDNIALEYSLIEQN